MATPGKPLFIRGRVQTRMVAQAVLYLGTIQTKKATCISCRTLIGACIKLESLMILIEDSISIRN